MPPLRIVVAMIEPPTPFGNAAARWYYVLLRGLVERGHEVTAFAACSRPDEMEEARRLFPEAEYDLRLYAFDERRGLLGKLESFSRPYSYVFSQEFKRDFRARLAGGFDVLHLEHLWGGWLGLNHVDRSLIHIHYLFRIDQSGAPAGSAQARLLRAATQRAEAFLLRSYPTITTLSPRLTDAVRRISPGSDVRTVPLGLDPSLYPFEPDRPTGGAPVVGLIGSFLWWPTATAARRLLTRLWPEIRRRVPSARLRLVGRDARSALAGSDPGPGVEVFEDVPDILPYFQSTDVLVYAPGPASGMKVKVLESFALGTPVVTNADGVEGLPAEDGVHAGICDDDAGLIDRAVALLEDPARRDRQRASARALLEAHCGPGPVLDRLERVHDAIAGRSAIGAPSAAAPEPARPAAG